MDTTSASPVIDRFFYFLKVLVERVSRMPTPGSPPPWEYKPPLSPPVMMAVLFRLGRLRKHFKRLTAQAMLKQSQTQTQTQSQPQTQTQTQTQPQAQPQTQTQTQTQTAAPPAPRRVPPSRTTEARRLQKAARARALALSGVEQVVLPTKFGWLAHMIADAPSFRARFIDLLRDPELAAMVAAEPRLGRVLRPLVHMLGLRRKPDMIALHPLPRRVRTPRPRPARLSLEQQPEPKRTGVVIIDYWDVMARRRIKPG